MSPELTSSVFYKPTLTVNWKLTSYIGSPTFTFAEYKRMQCWLLANYKLLVTFNQGQGHRQRKVVKPGGANRQTRMLKSKIL